jgi:hypothetical protein
VLGPSLLLFFNIYKMEEVIRLAILATSGGTRIGGSHPEKLKAAQKIRLHRHIFSTPRMVPILPKFCTPVADL